MPLESTQDALIQRHAPLAENLWRSGKGGLSATLRGVTLVILGTALLTLSAKINVPLPYVPITLQTLVVLVIGSVYGWRLGGLTLMAYLAEGAAGLPVFAGTIGGLVPFMGPTAGYLAGFVFAAVITGWLSESGWDRSVLGLFIALAIGHAVILASGFAWLAYGLHLGPEKAWLVGIMPFIAGTVVKNALATALVMLARQKVEHRG